MRAAPSARLRSSPRPHLTCLHVLVYTGLIVPQAISILALLSHTLKSGRAICLEQSSLKAPSFVAITSWHLETRVRGHNPGAPLRWPELGAPGAGGAQTSLFRHPCGLLP